MCIRYFVQVFSTHFAYSKFNYVLINLFIFLLQQSIFLVVIIESFADLRDESLFWKNTSSSLESQMKPKRVNPKLLTMHTYTLYNSIL